MVLNQTQHHILIAITDHQIRVLLERVLRSAGYLVTVCADRESVITLLQNYPAGNDPPDLFILGERIDPNGGVDLAADLIGRLPNSGLILFVSRDNPELLKRAMRLGVTDYLCPPLRSDDIIRSVRNALELTDRRKEWLVGKTKRTTAGLQRQVDELETLTQLGRSITESLDLDMVLAAIVEAAVRFTGAEEGSILLLDDATGELYMRASRNFQEEFARTFRLPVTDTLAGSVIQTGKPVLLDDQAPQKIKTSYLVQSLVYVPLTLKGRVIGVLGVDHRHSHAPFTDRHVKQLSALAEFAAISIHNANLFSSTRSERNRLETLLTQVSDGVIVTDQDLRLVLVNKVVRELFDLGTENLTGKPFRDIFYQPELVDLVSGDNTALSNRVDLELGEGQIFSTRFTRIPEVGSVITMHDITNLKRLDHIKSEFVQTVSHDLRSPLTAILGYVELVGRAGPVTELQQEFIERVQTSVQNITNLVDDLLNLGRIEAGFDARKEIVPLAQIIRFSSESLKPKAAEKNQVINLVLPDPFPNIVGNPVQIRQMLDNLIENAIKYTPPGGIISVIGDVAQNQVILQVHDNGIGIPSIDLPYIFDKFYRASNASPEIVGSGLGLAIVKSIVDNHQGRIWVDSTVGSGTTFTVVLPLQQPGM